MPGHLFIVQGDLTRLACDAWLLPTDHNLHVEPHWVEQAPRAARARMSGGRVSIQKPAGWRSDGIRALKFTDWLGGDKRPQPWLVNVGMAAGTPVAWYLDGVRDFIHAAAPMESKREFAFGRSKPLLAVPVVGTGEGGASAIKGDVIRSLVAALEAHAQKLDVDLVLVTYTPAALSAAQAARRRLVRTWPELDENVQAVARQLSAHAWAGRLVLFLGAGVSRGAGLPGWRELLDHLASQVGLNPKSATWSRLDNLDQARVVAGRLEQRGDNLADVITKRFTATHYSLAHALLASLPTTEAATMNYDTLFEQACAALGQPVAVLPYEPTASRSRWLLKMHGSIDAKPPDIVLTREDYLRYTERRGALAGIVQALLITRHLLFVGFSLQDDNFHRIADDVRKAIRGGASLSQDRKGRSTGRPFGTALLATVDPLLNELWQGDIECVSLASGVDEDIAQATRRLEVFLDLLLAESTTNTNHLLDPTYSGLLDADERSFAEALRTFAARLPPSARRTAAWRRFEAVLRSLGGADDLVDGVAAETLF